IIERINAGQIQGFTSVLSLTECLFRPFQARELLIEAEYRDLLLLSKGLSVTPILQTTAIQAALLRAQYSLSTQDAVQIASALESGCQAFLTNDGRLRNITVIKVLILDDLHV